MVGHEEQRTKPLGGWSAMVTWLKLQFGIHYYSELFRTIPLISTNFHYSVTLPNLHPDTFAPVVVSMPEIHIIVPF